MSRQILIDCERMKNHYTGLHHFCYNLGSGLQKAINPLSEQLTFFLPASEIGTFGNDQKYLLQKTWHKLLMPSLKEYAVFHATHQDTNYFPLRSRLPVVLTIHDINYIHSKSRNEKQKAFYIKQLKSKIDKAAHVVFISNYTKSDVMKYIDLAEKPVSTIYNGGGIAALQQLTAPAIVPTTSFYFTIGTIMEKKNFHVLPQLLCDNNNKLLIAGITQRESYKQEIINEAKKHGVADRVIFLGAVSENDKQWYIKNCEAFLFPSVAEGFGLPVVEAMNFGVPVFLSRHTSLPEIGGDVCYYFSSFEKEIMQDTIKKGLAHYNSTFAKDNIKKRANTFSWEKAAKQYLDVYRSLG